MSIVFIQDHSPLHCLVHARNEWSFFRHMKQRGQTIRRMWASHYAHLRGWYDGGVFILPENHRQPRQTTVNHCKRAR